MSFTIRLWTLTVICFAVFRVWIFIHDTLVPGLSPTTSLAVVALTAWIFGIAGTVIIARFHRRG